MFMEVEIGSLYSMVLGNKLSLLDLVASALTQ